MKNENIEIGKNVIDLQIKALKKLKFSIESSFDKAVNIISNDGLFEGEITLKIHNVSFLNSLIKKLKTIEGLKTIRRSYKLD